MLYLITRKLQQTHLTVTENKGDGPSGPVLFVMNNCQGPTLGKCGR